MNEIASIKIERWPIERIKLHPENTSKIPKVNSKPWKVLERSLDHDYFDPLVVNARNDMLVSGHKRFAVMKHRGVKEVDVSVVDYDEETHLARLIAGNEHAGKPDKDAIEALMERLTSSSVDLSLTGIVGKKPARPRPDAPPDLGEVYEIIVECSGEGQQQELYERFKQEGLKCRLLTL